MKKIFILFCACCSLVQGFSQPVNLGTAADYALLGLPSTSLTLSNVTVNGKVGVSQSGSLTINSPSTVNGNVMLNTGASYSSTGTVNGTVYTNQNISQAWNDAISAANFAAALTPTQSFANWSSTITING